MLWENLRSSRRNIAKLLLWSAVEAAPALFSGALVSLALDHGFLNGDFGTGMLILGGYAALVAVCAAGARQATMPQAEIVESLRYDLIVRTARAMMRRGAQGEEPVDGRNVEGITKHTEGLRILLSQLLTVVRTSAFSLVFVIAGLFFLAPLVAWVALASVALMAAVLAATARGWQLRIRDALLAEERVSQSAADVLPGIRDVVACAATDRAKRDLMADVEAHTDAAYLVGKTVAARLAVIALGGRLPLMALLVTGPFAVAAGTLTPGQLMGAATYLIGNFDPVLRAIVRVVGDIGMQLGVLLARVQEYARMPQEHHDDRVRQASGTTLELHGVCFSYSPASERILDGVDLRIGAGERIAFVGPSGAGKSTLANLLAGLEEPQHGSITMGGAETAELNRAWLHRTIALLPQEAYVFSGTLRENLAYLNPAADDGELLRACRAVGSADLVAERGGLDAWLEAPSELSEGQKQLIALTRTYVAPAAIVVLDEATCHLHPERERQAEDAFAATGRTVIVIAHRMSSAMRADRVVLLHGGRTDVGTHAELCTSSPLYADLVGYWNET
ncbi:ABC transporter ATP-binding protein [Streptomonospora sediminis]